MLIMRRRLERIDGVQLHSGGSEVADIVYRFGHYVVARNGRWWFGQYALMIRDDEIEPLLRRPEMKERS